jgi:nicotinate phosphoribosyltransferase
MGQALITDLYELAMAGSYLHRGMTEPATFSLFIRELPPERGFVVVAGLEDCLSYLERFQFDAEDTAWLSAHGFPPDMVEAFGALRFTGDVHAVPEGRVLLAGEPLLEVTAPLPEAQLVESFLLNRASFQTVLASKAARCRLAAGDMELVDFSLRRTHGTDAAQVVARVSAIAGFSGTSNVDAARTLGLRAAGTMAHSYVQSFATEADAFRAYVADMPGPYTFLVDTYDTLDGVRVAAEVVRELRLDGPVAVRLDSGNLAALSLAARRILDDAGLPQVRIFVSGGLDEYDLEELRLAGAPIDAAGVGTKVGVAADAPYLDTAYKLVQLGSEPVAKLSEGKETLPGPKQVWRRGGAPDVLARRDEDGPPGAEPLLVPVLRGGKRLGPPATIAAARHRLETDLAWLPADALRIRQPHAPAAVISEELQALGRETWERVGTGAARAARRPPATA